MKAWRCEPGAGAQPTINTVPENQDRRYGKIELVVVNQITHCSGAGDYVELNFADGSTRLHSGSLNELEVELPPAFIRVHRSHIVNTAFVESLQREPSGVGRLRITTGKFVAASRRIMPTVRRAIGSADLPAQRHSNLE